MDALKKLLLKIASLRLLDGYIGILGTIVWYKLLADYGGWIYLFELSARAWKIDLFSIGADWHTHNNRNTTYCQYPPLTAHVRIGKWVLIDTGAEADRKTSENVSRWIAEEKRIKAEREAETNRLVQLAIEAGLQTEGR